MPVTTIDGLGAADALHTIFSWCKYYGLKTPAKRREVIKLDAVPQKRKACELEGQWQRDLDGQVAEEDGDELEAGEDEDWEAKRRLR